MGASAQLKCHPQGVWRREVAGGFLCGTQTGIESTYKNTQKTCTRKLDLLILQPGSIFPDLTSPHDLVAVFRFFSENALIWLFVLFV